MVALSRILVIGASGTIGRAVLREADALGIEAVGAYRTARSASSHRGSGPALVLDPADADALAEALRDVDAVVLAHGGDHDPEAAYATVAAVIDAALPGATPIALMTSMGTSDPNGAFASVLEWKKKGEILLRRSRLRHVIVRPGWFGYQGAADVRADLRQGDLVTGQRGVDVRHIAQVLLHGLLDADESLTLEIFSTRGEPIETGAQWAEALAALEPDRDGVDEGPLDRA